MKTAEYWIGKISRADIPLLDQEEIASQNENNFRSPDTKMYDLKTYGTDYDGDAIKADLAKALMDEVRDAWIGPRTTIYRDGTALDETAMDSWFARMKKNIEGAATSSSDQRRYGLCVSRAELRIAPTTSMVGWSAADPDSEFVCSATNINEPLLVDIVTEDGQYAHVLTTNCDGWMEMERIAICDSKDEWLDQWDLQGRDDVLVVTTSHIMAETPGGPGRDLYLGTLLPLVSKEKLAGIGESAPADTLTVRIPTRGANGQLVREIARITSPHGVSIGFPELTQKNILMIAFTCLGDRYGWGGMMGAMDCSLYMRNIYRCFGMELPRNTIRQVAMPVKKTDMTELSDEKKRMTIGGLMPGALLMFPGHISMYLGMEEEKPYVISDLGSLIAPDGSTEETNMYCVSINSLDVKRANGNTWLKEMKWAVTPFVRE